MLTAIAARAGSPARVVRRRTTHLPLMEKPVARGHGRTSWPRHTTRDRAEVRLALQAVPDALVAQARRHSA